MIRLDDAPTDRPRRPRRWRLLLAPAPVALVLAVGAITPAANWLASRPTPPVLHTVQVGVSAYPAKVTAVWRDRRGATHTLDPWTGHSVRVPASEVVVAVAAPPDGSVQCTLTVDDAVDTDDAQNSAVALCSWGA